LKRDWKFSRGESNGQNVKTSVTPF